MPRRRRYAPLRVHLNNRLVGYLRKEPSGAIDFRYDESWLAWEQAIPVSLCLPLQEDVHRGEPVIAVFENLLPDSDMLRRRIAERVGARGTDAYNLLTKIGRDCVGALQFLDDDDVVADSTVINGEVIDDDAIERLLNNLAQAPLGLGRDDDFRISIAGAQEKTALLWHEGRWLKPHGTTPTTHILKTQIGQLPNGIDLSNSVENEFYCLKVLEAFGLPVNDTEIRTFGQKKALVVERFDRLWSRDGRLLRLPQEDCCQALSVPPSVKYQSDGGPGIAQILDLLKGSDSPEDDQRTFLTAQILFWMIGATDGHAKNFSIYLASGGRFHMTPLYDVLTVQPTLDSHQVRYKEVKLAMFAGRNRHYRLDEIHPRHFVQTALDARTPKSLIQDVIEQLIAKGWDAFDTVAEALPNGFPEEIHSSVRENALVRLKRFEGVVDRI